MPSLSQPSCLPPSCAPVLGAPGKVARLPALKKAVGTQGEQQRFSVGT